MGLIRGPGEEAGDRVDRGHRQRSSGAPGSGRRPVDRPQAIRPAPLAARLVIGPVACPIHPRAVKAGGRVLGPLGHSAAPAPLAEFWLYIGVCRITSIFLGQGPLRAIAALFGYFVGHGFGCSPRIGTARPKAYRETLNPPPGPPSSSTGFGGGPPHGGMTRTCSFTMNPPSGKAMARVLNSTRAITRWASAPASG